VDFSQITDQLYIGKTPTADDYDTLRALGVRLVINMRFERRPARDRHNPALSSLWLPTFDSPLVRIPVRALLRGVQAAQAVLDDGGKVYAHCAGGAHRGVAMGAAILISQGYTAAQAMALIKQRRPGADPYAWYIRRQIERFEETWKRLDTSRN
jgi:protein tyrosine phosphatase (PTP) superfamily phosphohydrolase (DUF442 family)